MRANELENDYLQAHPRIGAKPSVLCQRSQLLSIFVRVDLRLVIFKLFWEIMVKSIDVGTLHAAANKQNFRMSQY